MEESSGNEVLMWSWSSWPLWVSVHLCLPQPLICICVLYQVMCLILSACRHCSKLWWWCMCTARPYQSWGGKIRYVVMITFLYNWKNRLFCYPHCRQAEETVVICGSFGMYDCLKQPVRNLVKIIWESLQKKFKSSVQMVYIPVGITSTAFQSSIQSSIGLHSGDKYIPKELASAFQSPCPW